jgi:hypothetical protein
MTTRPRLANNAIARFLCAIALRGNAFLSIRGCFASKSPNTSTATPAPLSARPKTRPQTARPLDDVVAVDDVGEVSTFLSIASTHWPFAFKPGFHRIDGARLLVASSRNKRGLVISVRPITGICCSPSDSVPPISPRSDTPGTARDLFTDCQRGCRRRRRDFRARSDLERSGTPRVQQGQALRKDAPDASEPPRSPLTAR